MFVESMSFHSLQIVSDQNFRVFIIMEIGSKHRCSATYMAAKLSRKWSFFALNKLFNEPICTPLHFIGNLNMAPSKKWICQLILLHYNLPCKSIKKNPDWLKPWMTFFFDERDLTQQLHCLEKCTKVHFDKILSNDNLVVGVTFCSQ